jgi:hypothetical protein
MFKSNSLAVPLRSAHFSPLVSSGRIIFGGGYENCPEFVFNLGNE